MCSDKGCFVDTRVTCLARRQLLCLITEEYCWLKESAIFVAEVRYLPLNLIPWLSLAGGCPFRLFSSLKSFPESVLLPSSAIFSRQIFLLFFFILSSISLFRSLRSGEVGSFWRNWSLWRMSSAASSGMGAGVCVLRRPCGICFFEFLFIIWRKVFSPLKMLVGLSRAEKAISVSCLNSFQFAFLKFIYVFLSLINGLMLEELVIMMGRWSDPSVVCTSQVV